MRTAELREPSPSQGAGRSGSPCPGWRFLRSVRGRSHKRDCLQPGEPAATEPPAATGEDRSLPFGAHTKPSDRLFPDLTPDQVSTAFARACRKAGIEDFHFHDLRHTAASWLRMQGADIHTVAQLLGHKDLRMAARYQHLSPAFLAEAVRGLDSVFGTVCYQSVTGPTGLPEPEPGKRRRLSGVPSGIRTRVSALKGRCPRPG